MAALADYASTDVHEKLTIAGIFRQITAPSFPAAHPFLVLALVFEAEPEDIGRSLAFAVRVVGPDGGVTAGPMEGDISVEGSGGIMPTFNLMLQMRDVGFPAPGPHVFEIAIAGTVVHELRLDAVRVASGR